jgi:hypothetical protein
VGIITLWAVWIGLHLFHTHANVQQSASITPQSPPAVSPPAAVENPKASIAASLPAVLHQEIPDLSRSARESIRGVIKIAVRVIVDRSGKKQQSEEGQAGANLSPKWRRHRISSYFS